MLLNEETLYNSLKIVYSFGLITSPLWGAGVLFGTLMMNDSGCYRERFRYGCIISFLATPVALTYSVYKLHQGDKRTLTTLLPLIPISSYITFYYSFWDDPIEKK
ncbi:hypothetical protein ACTFIV_004921 [Dictyostelium citrinum]